MGKNKISLWREDKDFPLQGKNKSHLNVKCQNSPLKFSLDSLLELQPSELVLKTQMLLGGSTFHHH